ncbi:hypothetical protein Pmani_009507 [Petrolisthes manimaculis]|uniref:VPS37 C-terminal domain-containing protein n=1 Tax=Petrolisthes manimaculis TaxID=1843537 RepID=A0AAE1Q6B0_9EUCA|nr:hypothetical protein Pmani_009507 [Petrolisthes manimaculis]
MDTVYVTVRQNNHITRDNHWQSQRNYLFICKPGMMSEEPDYGAVLGLISHLSKDELQDLVNNDEKLAELLKDLPQMKHLANQQEMLLASNKSLAEFNLGLEPKLSQAKQNLIAKYEEAAQLSESVNTLKGQVGK